MAKLVAGSIGFDMTAIDFNDMNTGVINKETSTVIDLTGSSGTDYHFTGINFKYNGPFPQSGTLQGFTFTDQHGHIEVTVTGGSMPITDAFNFFEHNDVQGFETEFFKGNDTLTGGAGKDVLEGFAGNDVITGGGGADTLDGGKGHDVFVYGAASDSTSTQFDTINGIDFRNGDTTSDKLKLPFAVQAINTEVITGKLSLSTFDSQLAHIINSNKLGANDAVLFDPSSGGEKGQIFLIIDANGTPGYQAGQDIVIHLTNAAHLSNLDTSDFTT